MRVDRLVWQLPVLFIGWSVASCAVPQPDQSPLIGQDVTCLEKAVSATQDFRLALHQCGTTKPDLTGSTKLQRLALDNKVPFTIRPIADAQIKDAIPYVHTGDLLPSSDTPQDRPPVLYNPIL